MQRAEARTSWHRHTGSLLSQRNIRPSNPARSRDANPEPRANGLGIVIELVADIEGRSSLPVGATSLGALTRMILETRFNSLPFLSKVDTTKTTSVWRGSESVAIPKARSLFCFSFCHIPPKKRMSSPLYPPNNTKPNSDAHFSLSPGWRISSLKRVSLK